MILTLILVTVSFVAGLLVGRKNKALADRIASELAEAKAKLEAELAEYRSK